MNRILSKDFSQFSILDYLKTEEDIIGYMQAILEYGSPELLQVALIDVELARSKF